MSFTTHERFFILAVVNSLFRCIFRIFGHTQGNSLRFSVPASMAISVFLEIDHVACVWQKQVLIH